MRRIGVTGLLAACVLWCVACGSARVHRLTDFEYNSLPSDAEIDLFAGPPLDRPYEPIAIIDSERYKLRDYAPDAETGLAQRRHKMASAQHEAMLDLMLRDLEVLARELGGDAVHKIRLLSTDEESMIPDEAVPLPGAIVQGVHHRYFRRGELIKYTSQAGPLPLKQLEISDPTVGSTTVSAPDSNGVPLAEEPAPAPETETLTPTNEPNETKELAP